MDQFNTREIASITWGTIFIIGLVFYSLKNAQLRSSLIAVIKAFFQIKIITSILLITTYLVLIVSILYQMQIWDFSQLKNTFFWYIVFAIGTMFSLHTIKENSNDFFIDTIQSSISLSVFLQFITNLHTFNFFIELILIVPIISILTIFSTIARQNSEQLRVKRLCDFLLAVIFIIFFIYFLIQIFRDLSNFANYQIIQDFITPIILTILYLPFLWFFLLYIKYEEIFVRLPIFLENKKLVRSAKFLIIINFRTQKDLLDQWFHHIKIHKIENYKQLFDSFALIKHRSCKRRKLIDTPTLLEIGWSVYEAENYLSGCKLKVKYSDIGDDIWFGSKLIELDENFNLSTLAYYIQGNENVVSQLKIKLFLQDPNSVSDYLDTYIETINCLLNSSLQTNLSSNQTDNIYNLKKFSDTLYDKNIEFHYEGFMHSSKPTCELVFSIKNPS